MKRDKGLFPPLPISLADRNGLDTRALHGSPVLSIPLEAHHKAQSSEIFLSFLVKSLKSFNSFNFWPILLKLHI